MSRKSPSRTQHPSGTVDLQKTLAQGNQLLQSKKYRKALTVCERYLATMPDNPYVLSLAGIASDLNQQPHNAVDYFRRAVAVAPNEATLYYNLAKSLKQTGNIQEAISTYQQALNLAPDNQAILLNLANLYLNEENADAAIPLFQNLLQINPTHIKALRGLGAALRLDGQLDRARDCFLKAHELAPADSHTLVDLGDIYYRLNQLVEAESYYRKAVELSPNDPALYSNLGIVLNSLDKHPEAIDAFKIALNIDPMYIAALKNLGTTLIAEEPEAAKEYFARANSLTPEDVDIMASLAYAYYQLGDISRAESIYREAIELTPDHAQSHYGVGICLIALGRKSEAIDKFRKTLQLDPGHVHAYLQLASTIKYKEHNDDVVKMEKLLDQPTLDNLEKSYLHFGLGKVYEDLQKYDEAFTHYAAGNNLKRSTIKFNITDDSRLIENIAHTFNTELFARFEGCGFPSNNPIFIVGMPRSGTTLTEQIISSHPDVFGAGEITHLRILVENYFNQQLKTAFPQNIERLDCQSLKQLGSQYYDITSQLNTDARHITNKMPYNFLYIGLIQLILPNAKIIHCKRNPLDTCFSCYSKSFATGNSFTYTLKELGQYYGLYYRLMQHWRQLDAIDIIEISYEDLINDQENQTRRLLDACGLEWNNACLNFHKSSRPVMTASVNQVRDKIYNKSVQRWKHFEKHLTPLINTLKDEIPSSLIDI